MENRSEKTRAGKVYHSRVFYLVLYLAFGYFRKWKTRSRAKSYAITCSPMGSMLPYVVLC